MKAIPLVRRCRGARSSGWRGRGEPPRTRWRWGFSTLLPILLLFLTPTLCILLPTTLVRLLGLAVLSLVLVLVLLPRLFCLPLRLDARNLLLAHRLLRGSGGSCTRINELGGKSGVGEVRLACVEKVDRVGGGEAGCCGFRADVACARRCGGLSCPRSLVGS